MAKSNSAFNKPLVPTSDLAAIVGKAALSRSEAVKKMWEYIKKHKLQDAKDGRIIVADAKLKPLFGIDKVNMMKLGGIISKNLSAD